MQNGKCIYIIVFIEGKIIIGYYNVEEFKDKDEDEDEVFYLFFQEQKKNWN